MKKIGKAVFIASLAATGLAQAHDSGLRSLGKAASATDFYEVTCFDDGTGPTDHLFTQVRDEAPSAPPVVSLQVFRGDQNKALNTTDAVDGNATYSPAVRLKGGNGTYRILVNKTAAGAENYTFEYHCETSTGAHTGTPDQPTVLQNQ